MPFITADRVKETSTTTGTGSYTLAGASANFRAFSAVCANGDTVNYAAVDTNGAGWEVGLGTWSTGNTLARTTIYASSNGGAAVNWSAGTRDVFLTAAATFLASRAASGANSDITSLSGLTTALSVAQGGTGATSLTANNVILGNGTSAVQFVAPGASGNVLTSNGTTWVSQAGGGGGLNFFTTARSVAAPNATVPVHSLEASGTEANIDVAVVPKGTGAFTLQVANNATTGGNKRGTNAVDLQTSRTSASQVASGDRSFAAGAENTAGTLGIAIGRTNTASGNNRAAVAIGDGNTASNNHSVAIGANNSATGSGGNSFAFGRSNSVSSADCIALGMANTVSGAATTAIGFTNTSDGVASTAVGGARATANGIAGIMVYGFQGETVGRNQMSFFGARPITTNATTRRATADDAGAAASNQLTLRNNSAFTFRGMVVARDTSTNDMKSWEFTGAVKRGATAGTTAIVGTPTTTVIAEDTNASTWTIALSADTTNGALAVDVTGQAAKTIRWTVVIQSAEVN